LMIACSLASLAGSGGNRRRAKFFSLSLKVIGTKSELVPENRTGL
jgi:hypothetical protein